MALVVAMAGMMLPAIPEDMLTTVDWGGKTKFVVSRLISNLELDSIWNIAARRLAVAATKSRVSSSSLSKVKIGGVWSEGVLARSPFRRWLRRLKL